MDFLIIVLLIVGISLLIISYFRSQSSALPFGILFILVGIGCLVIQKQEWRVISREQAIVRQMGKNGFQFKYLVLKDMKIPLIDPDDDETKALLDSWNVQFQGSAVNQDVGDTLYCYTLEQYYMGRSTDKALKVYAAPVQSYEFSLFYNQGTEVDTTGAEVVEFYSVPDSCAIVQHIEKPTPISTKGAGSWWK